MHTFHLRMILRNYSPLFTWAQLDESQKALFQCNGTGITSAEFFIAKAAHSSGQFVVTQTSFPSAITHRADIIAVQYSDLVILADYHATGFISFPVSSIESVALKIAKPARIGLPKLTRNRRSR
jgi:hypothetical protein